ncbi:unnamed protein product, partial [Polarella glacialis]
MSRNDCIRQSKTSCSWLRKSVAALGTGLESLEKSLRHLQIDMKECRALKSLTELCDALAKLSALRTLNLEFFRCSALRDVCLPPLVTLRHLTLDLRECGLESPTELGLGLARLVALETLHLDLRRCSSLRSAAEIGRGIAPCRVLRSLELELGGGQRLAELGPDLGCGLGQLAPR